MDRNTHPMGIFADYEGCDSGNERLNTDRVAEIENYLSDIVRNDPDDSTDQREQLALYIVELEERIEKLERRLNAKTGF